MEYKLIEKGVVEVGVDPSFDNNYEDSYCVSFTTDELYELIDFMKDNGCA